MTPTSFDELENEPLPLQRRYLGVRSQAQSTALRSGMRFTLSYHGRLPSQSDAKTKHRIRTDLHPQLKELWRTHPALAGSEDWITENAPDDSGNEYGVLLKAIGANTFASLVHPYLKLYAELDILMLRPESPGAVISHSGDIDNQLKTLFDALRRPVDASEVPSGWIGSEEQTPLHCLLDDDKLITRANVETDRLLLPERDPKEVDITIRGSVKRFSTTWGNIGLIS